MCGIVGLIGFDNLERSLSSMLSATKHRGPDDEGIWCEHAKKVGLGHRRLSIIDLSSAGHQPMTHDSGRYWLVFNGEIYNYKELRSELEASGTSFVSHTDSEVLLAAYSQWGIGALSRLRGMFAFAIWDNVENCLFLARDRLGIKPLLFARHRQSFVFASELKAILTLSDIDRHLNLRALLDLFSHGSCHQPNSFIDGVKWVRPGSWMRVHLDCNIEEGRYWHLADNIGTLRREYQSADYNDLVKLTRNKLDDACKAHLVSDVPVGSFLSGGVDSSAVTGLMGRITCSPVNTFSLGYKSDDGAKDELGYALKAAALLGCNHTAFELDGKFVFDHFNQFIQAIDQPSEDGLNTFFVSKITTDNNIKVAISGLGSDELFAGYPHFVELLKSSRRKANIFDRALASINQARPNRFTHLAWIRSLPINVRYETLRSILRLTEILSILAPDLRQMISRMDLSDNYFKDNPPTDDSILDTSIYECDHYLVDTLLRDSDTVSMAHSLEVRPIFLDHHLVEHAFSLPGEAKLRFGRRKAVLIDAISDLLPSEFFDRPKKGFELPVGSWLRTRLRQTLISQSQDTNIESLFSHAFLKSIPTLIDNPQKTRMLWVFLVFSSWFNRYNILPPK